jgi:hypothetical protein
MYHPPTNQAQTPPSGGVCLCGVNVCAAALSACGSISSALLPDLFTPKPINDVLVVDSIPENGLGV